MFPCQHGGTCTDSPEGFHCTCSTGFTGQTCHIRRNTYGCQNMICLNGGSCLHFGNISKCICPDGYLGHHCEIKKDRCHSSRCRNGGTCVDNGELLFCKCPVGLVGKYCEKGEGELVYCLLIYRFEKYLRDRNHCPVSYLLPSRSQFEPQIFVCIF